MVSNLIKLLKIVLEYINSAKDKLLEIMVIKLSFNVFFFPTNPLFSSKMTLVFFTKTKQDVFP